MEEFESKHPVSMMSPDGDTRVFSLHQGDSKKVPYAWALLTVSEETPEDAVFWMIYVRESYRGRGYAKELIEFLQGKFSYLYTHYERGLLNSAGVRLCMSMGFKQVPSMHKNVPSELVWEKEK